MSADEITFTFFFLAAFATLVGIWNRLKADKWFLCSECGWYHCPDKGYLVPEIPPDFNGVVCGKMECQECADIVRAKKETE